MGVKTWTSRRYSAAAGSIYLRRLYNLALVVILHVTSENGGFAGTLRGLVKRISPQVRQRKVISTDPTGDADARVIEVRIALSQNSASMVKNLTGIKVIARFIPK